MSRRGGNSVGASTLGLGTNQEHARTIMQMLRNGAAARSEIVASWDRCVRLHKLNPERDGSQFVASQMELREAVDHVGTYLQAADLELENIARQMGKLSFFVSFANADGLALSHRGCVPDLGRSNLKVTNGMCWHERSEGTNAIGTALYMKRPIVIYRDEHFYYSNSLMTCLATPLFGPTGSLVGALNATTIDQRADRSLACVLLALLIAAAQRMEAAWFRNAHPKCLVVPIPEATCASGSTALLAVDVDLNVLGATHGARTHCRIEREALEAGVQLDQIGEGIRLPEPSLVDSERGAIKRALALSGQKVSAAANRLGISRATMHRKMVAYNLRRKPQRRTTTAPSAQA
jgi:transcriptional regulator of acetoin/glycerol metabolism